MTILLLSLAACSPDGDQDTNFGSTESTDDTAPDSGDGDGDGFGANDCNDTDNSIHPAAIETCDGVDQDCDGFVDDEPSDGRVFYPDGDADSYGTDARATTACAEADGWVDVAGDCDDADSGVHPLAAETCDGRDEDCDEITDDACMAAPSGEIPLELAYGTVNGGEPGTYFAWTNSAGMAENDELPVSSMPLLSYATANCADERVFLFSAIGPGVQTATASASGVVMGDAESCIGYLADTSADGDSDGYVDVITQSYGQREAFLFRGPLVGERHADTADLTVGTEMEGLVAAQWIGDIDGVPGSEFALGNSFYLAPYDYYEFRNGQAEIYSGIASGSLGSEDAVAHIWGTPLDCAFGKNFAAIGDLDGDGLGEFAVNAAWFFYGPVLGDVAPDTAEIVLYTSCNYDQWGRQAVPAGDIDGDGRDDVAVSVTWDNEQEQAVVFLGDADRGKAFAEEFTTRITVPDDLDHDPMGGLTTGDFNGDGDTDVLLGGDGPVWDAPLDDSPAIRLLYGPFAPGIQEWNPAAVFTVDSHVERAGSGTGLVSADLNQDGFDDIIAGVEPADNDDPGWAHIVLGGP